MVNLSVFKQAVVCIWVFPRLLQHVAPFSGTTPTTTHALVSFPSTHSFSMARIHLKDESQLREPFKEICISSTCKWTVHEPQRKADDTSGDHELQSGNLCYTCMFASGNYCWLYIITREVECKRIQYCYLRDSGSIVSNNLLEKQSIKNRIYLALTRYNKTL